MLLPLRSKSLCYRWLVAAACVAALAAAGVGVQAAAAESTAATAVQSGAGPAAATAQSGVGSAAAAAQSGVGPAANAQSGVEPESGVEVSTATARPGVEQTGAKVQSAVERAAREHLTAFAEQAGLAEAQVRVTVVPRSGAAAPCSQRLAVEPLDTRHITRMRFAAICGATRTEYVARGAVTAVVVVASADIAANRPIAATQLARERRDVSGITGAISEIDAAVGQASRRAIRAGQVLSTRFLVQPVLVRRGAPVDIVARNAGVQVTVRGEAMEAGRRNEIVRVRNVGNGKVITARVVDEHTVEPANAGPQ
jgi:flagella basal body P-ring formation protein FlgA